jgi:hypothetical protein
MSNKCRNFWACSISTAVSCQALTKLSSHSPDATSGTGTLSWTPAMQLAFDTAKSLLLLAVPLQHPHPCAKLSLATDASDAHKGVVLQQFTQAGGSHWLSFQKNFPRRKCAIPLLTERCLFRHQTLPVFSWKVVLSHFLLITSHFQIKDTLFLMPATPTSLPFGIHYHHCSPTCMATTMWWLTHCHGHLLSHQPLHQLPPYQQPPSHLPLPQIFFLWLCITLT